MLDCGEKGSERSSTSKLICARVTEVFFEGLCGIEEGFEEVLPVLYSLNLLAFLANFTIMIVFDVQRKYAPFARERHHRLDIQCSHVLVCTDAQDWKRNHLPC